MRGEALGSDVTALTSTHPGRYPPLRAHEGRRHRRERVHRQSPRRSPARGRRRGASDGPRRRQPRQPRRRVRATDAQPELGRARRCADVDAMAAAFDGVDTVYHVAGLTAAFTRDEFARANAAGVANVLAAIRQAHATAAAAGLRVVVDGRRTVAPRGRAARAPRPARRLHPLRRQQARRRAAGPRRRRARRRRRGGDRAPAAPIYGPPDADMLQMIRSAKFGVIAQPGLRPTWMSFIHALRPRRRHRPRRRSRPPDPPRRRARARRSRQPVRPCPRGHHRTWPAPASTTSTDGQRSTVAELRPGRRRRARPAGARAADAAARRCGPSPASTTRSAACAARPRR